MFVIQTIYGWTGFMKEFDRGYSTISFIFLYLLARYVRLYGGFLLTQNKWKDFAIYCLCCVVNAGIHLFGLRVGVQEICSHTMLFINPLVITAAVFLLLFFSKLDFYSSAVNKISSSVFAVYLFHMNVAIWPLFCSTNNKISTTYPGSGQFLAELFFLLFVFVTAVVINQIFVVIWKVLLRAFKIELNEKNA